MEPTAGTPWRRGRHGGDDAMDVRMPWRTQLHHHPDAISEPPPDTSHASLMEGQGPHAQWIIQNAQASHGVSRHPLWMMTTTRASTATTTLRTWSNSATTSSTTGRRPWPCAASATTSSHHTMASIHLLTLARRAGA
ncbi:hypothetical protein VPH35_034162 [Triticum aestivum]|uniref:uncharacterized protein isoform X2 n=1 Tax=Triticum aestivum TaxID=4565 RepID=UPI001D021EFD|nr:uncharacterized protein LOC123051186 isoform X2 [Triticum aestivum]XP_044445199.1 uncharacterized protein LOC123172264 isoform X2 [Triticum aestivum]